MDQFIRLNTVFEVPADVSAEAIRWSEEISKGKHTYFVLNPVAHYPLYVHPHMTIYAPEYPAGNVESVIKQVKKFAQNTGPIEFLFSHIDNNEEGYVVVHFALSPEVKAFQKSLVDLLNPLREGRIRDKLLENKFPPAVTETIQYYGTSGVLDFYKPHITLTRFHDVAQSVTARSDVQWPIHSFVSDSIGVYVSGSNGTLEKPITVFRLSR